MLWLYTPLGGAEWAVMEAILARPSPQEIGRVGRRVGAGVGERADIRMRARICIETSAYCYIHLLTFFLNTHRHRAQYHSTYILPLSHIMYLGGTLWELAVRPR